MKTKRKNLKSRIFYSYIMSYVGVILIAISLLSILIAWQVSENMRSENLRVTEEKLYVIAEDIEQQIEAMRNVAFQIAGNPEYWKINFENNKYNEIEMVWDLRRYGNVTPISDYYFLKYLGDTQIYTSTGETLPFSVFGEGIEESAWEDVARQIEELCLERKISCRLMELGESAALMIYPLQRYIVSSVGMEAVVCFEIQREDVENRIRQIGGDLDGEIEVYYNDILISPMAEELSKEPILLDMASSEGNVRVTFRQSPDGYFSWTNVFSAGGIMILIGIVLVLLVAAILVAWKNYTPIRKLAMKYRVAPGNRRGNELEVLDILIESLLQKDEKNTQRLQSQYYVLREQMLRLISAGGYSRKMEQQLDILNIHFSGSVFGKILCTSAGFREEAAANENLETAIEDLADEGIRIYAFRENEDAITVLVSAEEKYQIEELCEALHALFEVREINADIKLQNVCTNLQELYLTARKEDIEQEAGNGENAAAKSSVSDNGAEMAGKGDKEAEAGVYPENAAKQKRRAKQVVQYIEENYTRYDLSLDSIAQEFHVTAAYLSRLIKQQTGISYKEYLTKLRMEEAKRLLEDPYASIANVCQKIGYSNVSHFIKIFQKQEGITPAKYRDQKGK